MAYRLVIVAVLIGCVSAPLLAKSRSSKKARRPSSLVQAEFEKAQWHLINLEKEARAHRHLLGGVFLGLSASLSGVLIAQERLRSGEPRRLAIGVSAFSAGAALLGAGFIFFSPTQAERGASKVREFSKKTSRKKAALFARAELRRYATSARTTRRLLGSVFMGLGLADIAWHFGEASTPDTAFLVYKGAAFIGLGISFLAFRWPHEIEYDEYKSSRYAKSGLSLRVLPSLHSKVPSIGMVWRF